MDIGYLLDVFPKTSESFVENEVRELKKDHRVNVFSIEGGEGDKAVEYYHRRLLRDGFPALFSFLKGDLLERSALEGHHRMVAEYFSESAEDMDVLHRHFATNSSIYYLSQKSGIPYTVTTHAWDIFSKNRYGHLKEVLNNAARVVTISEYNKRYMIDNFGVKRENIEVVRMGVDTERFRPDKVDVEERRLLSVGRLVEKKGFEYAIKAVERLAAEYSDVRYVIIGNGPEKEKLKRLVSELDIEENVEFLGKVSDERLMEEYGKAEVFILPCVVASDGDRDGIPVVLMEAMAMGKPVVSTSVSGIPELIDDRENGLLVEPRDEVEISAAVDRILADDLDLDEMSTKARRTIEERFNLEKQAREMERIFREVVEGD